VNAVAIDGRTAISIAEKEASKDDNYSLISVLMSYNANIEIGANERKNSLTSVLSEDITSMFSRRTYPRNSISSMFSEVPDNNSVWNLILQQNLKDHLNE